MDERITLGVSRCLLGEQVRYDGGHKLDHYLSDILGPFVDWVGVCPEHECGLPIPREAMHLAGDVDNPRLITVRTGVDHTERMHRWAASRLDVMEDEGLCGFVFKAKSPSSGMRDIKIYHENGQGIAGKGVGLFAKAFMDRFPLIPVEDEGRLHDPGLKENFIERIFVYQRWRDLASTNFNMKGLVDFHTRHKLLIMAHAPQAVSRLGRWVAQQEEMPFHLRAQSYFKALMETLKRPTTVKKNVNVLQHIQGYFKNKLQPDEKQELSEVIDTYHRGLTPLIVPVTLLNHHVRKWNEPYLKEQIYLHPHPLELMLRNHV